MRLDLLSGAEADLLEAYGRLERIEEAEELDRRFETLFGLIEVFPEIGRPYAGGYRRLLEIRSGYGIYYRIHGVRIVVSAGASPPVRN